MRALARRARTQHAGFAEPFHPPHGRRLPGLTFAPARGGARFGWAIASVATGLLGFLLAAGAWWPHPTHDFPGGDAPALPQR